MGISTTGQMSQNATAHALYMSYCNMQRSTGNRERFSQELAWTMSHVAEAVLMSGLMRLQITGAQHNLKLQVSVSYAHSSKTCHKQQHTQKKS